MINIVVFASGSGTNFQSIINAIESGQINGRIRGLITNKKEIQAIERARKHNIDHLYLNPEDYSSYSTYVDVLLNHLEKWDTELIALAGYMIKIPSKVIEKYKNRIVNIHPSLLPKYGGKGCYGMNVHRAVIKNGEDESGCTVHLVTEEYDQGPILGQRKVPVKTSDDAQTLAKRIQKQEHRLFPEIIRKLAEQLKRKTNH